MEIEHREISDIEIDGRILIADITVYIDREFGYGSDADGNRGSSRAWMEKCEINGIFDQDTAEDVTDQYKSNQKVVDQIERKL
jgi:hypothetical protein